VLGSGRGRVGPIYAAAVPPSSSGSPCASTSGLSGAGGVLSRLPPKLALVHLAVEVPDLLAIIDPLFIFL
jgi:hypothetical protein